MATPQRTAALLVAPLAVLAFGASFFAGYVKDDAYISLRYARNLASGQGLVFNAGERLEGYTNFLWIVLATPAFWLGVDPVLWVKALGCLSAAGATAYLVAASRWLHADRPAGLADTFGALFFASSTSVSLWAMSGLEGCFVGLVSVAGWLHLHRGRERRSVGEQALAGAWFLGAALTRPEGHALFALAVLPVAVDLARSRRVDRGALAFAAVFAGGVVPYHAFRVAWFGDWLPNTFYVKASAGPEVWERGWEYLLEFLAFGPNGVLLALGVVGAAAFRRGRAARLHALAVALFFALYLAKIGRDEMKHFRLYFPALPLLCLLGAEGLRAVLPDRNSVPVGRALAGARVVVASVLAWLGIDYTIGHHASEADYLRQSKVSFQAMGAFLEEQARPGDTCVFQDMGGTPFAAPSVRFVDTIGILDRTVARGLAEIRMNPFMRDLKNRQPGGAGEARAFDRRIRDYLFDQGARWVAFTAYLPKSARKRRAFGKQVDGASGDPAAELAAFEPLLRSNGYYHGMYADPRFAERYRYDRHWKRHAGYWLVLFERRGEGEGVRAAAPGVTPSAAAVATGAGAADPVDGGEPERE